MKKESHERVLALIPARYASQRLPGKLLYELNGISILRHVYERALECELIDELAIIVDDERLVYEAQEMEAYYLISGETHICGTDRCIGAIDSFVDVDILINIQADQPMIQPWVIDHLIKSILSDSSVKVASLMTQSVCTDSATNIVKVSIDKDGKAIAFYRDLPINIRTYRHIGIYAFRKSAIDLIDRMTPTDREKLVNLEQLRWMDHGMDIKMYAVDYTPQSLDVIEDIKRLENAMDS